MKKAAIAIIAILFAAGMAAFFYMREVGVTLRFTQQELQTKLSERMPIEKEYKLLTATLLNPRIQLQEGSDRVKAGVDVNLGVEANRFFPKELRWQGAIDASSSVRYEPSTGQIFLNTPVIDAFKAPGVPQRWLPIAEQAASQALQEWYATRPIYTLKTDQLKTRAAKLLLKKVTVEGGELVVTLGL